MKEIDLEHGYILSPFFHDAYDSCPEAFLDGLMGRGLCDSLEQPDYGIVQMGHYCYLGGNGYGLEKKNLLSIVETMVQRPYIVFVPLSESWDRLLFEDASFQKITRYAMDKPKLQYFNPKLLASYISEIAYDPNYVGSTISRRYTIKPINEIYYYLIQKQEWTQEFTTNYKDYATFARYGFGFIIIEGNTGKIAAISSSFSTSKNSIEIELATSPRYRKRGFGTAVAARMILECLNRKMFPRWDAANLISVKIAEKLGFTFIEEYSSYTRSRL